MELYRFRPLASLKVPKLVQLTQVNDGVPMEGEIEVEVWGVKGGRACGPSRMIVEDLKGWLK